MSGSTIQLYTVGTTGSDSTATPLLTQPATTDAKGNFDITGRFSCTQATQVYLTAIGGKPANASSNPDLTLMTALGPCSSLTQGTYITVNEVTTVAGVAALALYMTAAGSIGSNPADTKQLADAFTLASQFVNPATGFTPGSGVPFDMTVPSYIINTVGNILATCVDSAGGVAGDL